MKKSIFAVIMAIVMLFSVITVYALDYYVPDEDEVERSVEVCDFCGGIMIDYGCDGDFYNRYVVCTFHPNCTIVMHCDTQRYICRECGKTFEETEHVHSMIHNSTNK